MTDNRKEWRGDRDGRRPSQPESSPAWKQSRRRAETAASGKRPWFRILFSMMCLALFVAAAVYLFLDPVRQVTYIDVLTAFELSDQQTQGRENWTGGISKAPDAESIPKPGANQMLGGHQRQVAKATVEDWESSLNELASSGGFRNVDGETVVLYLQTGFVPGDKGSLLILNGQPCSPDLATGEYEQLNGLKDGLAALLKKRTRSSVLLMIDTPSMHLPLRFGQTGVNAAEQCLSWPQETGLEKLVVVTACSDQQVSWPLSMGSGGRTAFAHFVEQGLTTVADKDGDRSIRVSEYLQYLKQQTEDWVTKKRGPGLQTVLTAPSIEELTAKDNSRDFIVLRNPASVEPAIIAGGKDEELEARLESLCKLQDELRGRMAYRWSPFSWASAVDRLSLAESSYLSGSFDATRHLLDNAERHLKEADRSTSTYCRTPEELSPDEKLPISVFRDLPSMARLRESQMWSAELSSSGVSNVPLLTFEEVLQKAIATRAFSQQSSVTQDSTIKLINGRTNAESSVAAVFGSAEFLKNTILTQERRTSEMEDRFFIQPEDFTSADSTDLQWNIIRDLARTRSLAESRVTESLAELPGHLEWCASSGSVDEPLSRILTENLSMTGSKLNEFWLSSENVLASIPNESPRPAVHRSIVRQLIATRGIWAAYEKLSSSEEPADGHSMDELKKQHQELLLWIERLQAARNSATEGIALLVKDAVGDDPTQEKPVPAENRISRYHEYRNLLSLSVLTAGQRRALVRLIRKTDAVIAEEASDIGAVSGLDGEGRAGGICLQKFGRAQFTWQVQVLTLAPVHQEGDRQRFEFLTRAMAALTSGTPEESGRQLRQLGADLRVILKSDRLRVEQTLRNQAATTRELSATEMRARLLSAFDAMVFCAEPEPDRLTRLVINRHRQDYCQLQGRRLMQTGWVVQAGEETTGGQLPWFRQMANEWCKDLPAVLRDAVLTSRGDWGASSKFSNSLVRFADEGEQTCEVSVVVRDPDQFGGTAVLQIQPASSENSPEHKELLLSHQERTFTNLAMPVSSGNAPQKFGFRLRGGELLRGDCRPVGFSSRVFFRGRQLNLSAMTVDPCEGKSWLWSRTATSPNAEIALQTPDMRPIAFVVDWSGSMKEALGSSGADRQLRADEAARAIQEILEQQSELRKASLRVFGHRADWRKLNTKFAESFKDFAIAEPAAVPITSDQTDRDSQGLIAQISLDEGGKRTFEKAFICLKSSEPFGNTPLVYSLIEAIRNDLQSRSGIIVAVTDGEALDSGSNPEYEKYNRINELESALRQSRGDVQILLISFDVNDPVIRNKISAPFQTELLSKHCTVIDAANRDEILKQLEKKLAPPTLVIRADGQETTVDGKRTDEKDFRYEATLTPNSSYSLQYGKITSEQFGPIVVAAGDQLQTQIDWIKSRFRFQRQPRHRSMSVVENSERVVDSPTVLAATTQPVMTEQADGSRTLRLQLMVDHDNPDRPVRRPAEIEFEYLPTLDGSEVNQFRYAAGVAEKPIKGLGAPAWEVELLEWPRTGVQVNSFWKMSRTAPDLVLTWEQLKVAQSRSLALSTRKSGASEQLPSAYIWWRLLPDGRLQIRLDRDSSQPEADTNAVVDVRVEMGKRDTIGNAGSFVPKADAGVQVSRMENGDVVWEFDGQWTEDRLNALEFAFTSRESRHQGSTHLKNPLVLTDLRNVQRNGGAP
ncbi:MAG: hypothetical protein JNL58_10015 [Planctomyces sp.]|nr:hypothetical protein [Planctomyces sp.]